MILKNLDNLPFLKPAAHRCHLTYGSHGLDTDSPERASGSCRPSSPIPAPQTFIDLFACATIRQRIFSTSERSDTYPSLPSTFEAPASYSKSTRSFFTRETVLSFSHTSWTPNSQHTSGRHGNQGQAQENLMTGYGPSRRLGLRNILALSTKS